MPNNCLENLSNLLKGLNININNENFDLKFNVKKNHSNKPTRPNNKSNKNKKHKNN